MRCMGCVSEQRGEWRSLSTSVWEGGAARGALDSMCHGPGELNSEALAFACTQSSRPASRASRARFKPVFGLASRPLLS